jgi:ABC-type phosphate transport system substrate-binding protein
VTCTATDKAGNSATASFTITVVDPSPGGQGCNPTDGKISGRGTTNQNSLQSVLAQGYRDDVCGPTEGSAGNPAGNTMVAYNYPEAVSGNGTGSVAAQQAASCRTDAFGGSDVPYEEATLTTLDGAPGALGGCGITWTPPFQPAPGPFPNSADATGQLMSYPIGGSSVTILVNLASTDCGGTAQTAIQLTGVQLSRLLGGDIAMWNDPSLVAGNPSLSGCNVAVTRVVRTDAATSSSVLKSYLSRADEARSTSVNCGV